jgi:hydrogenase maturation protease HycI
VIVGIGHSLKADDYVGSLIAKDLKKYDGKNRFRVIDAEDMPENFLGLIDSMNPALVVVIDSLEAGLFPGAVRLVSVEETSYPFFSTHGIPIKVLLGSLGTIPRLFLLGVQSKTHEFGESISSEVQDARRVIVSELSEIMELLK